MRTAQTLLLLGLLYLSWAPTNLHAQDMPRTVVGSAGDYYDNLIFGSLHFTVGEIAVARYENGLELGEGFHRVYYDLIVDAEEILPQDWSVNVFPNPTTKDLRISLSTTAEVEAQLFSQNGQLVKQQEAILHEGSMDLSPLPAGTYILRLTDQDGRNGTFQILKIDY